jgi:hypothetical protein
MLSVENQILVEYKIFSQRWQEMHLKFLKPNLTLICYVMCPFCLTLHV